MGGASIVQSSYTSYRPPRRPYTCEHCLEIPKMGGGERADDIHLFIMYMGGGGDTVIKTIISFFHLFGQHRGWGKA